MRVYVVRNNMLKEKRCGCCSFAVTKLYQIAETQKVAKAIYRESKQGVCASCMVSEIINNNYKLI